MTLTPNNRLSDAPSQCLIEARVRWPVKPQKLACTPPKGDMPQKTKQERSPEGTPQFYNSVSDFTPQTCKNSYPPLNPPTGCFGWTVVIGDASASALATVLLEKHLLDNLVELLVKFEHDCRNSDMAVVENRGRRVYCTLSASRL